MDFCLDLLGVAAFVFLKLVLFLININIQCLTQKTICLWVSEADILPDIIKVDLSL